MPRMPAATAPQPTRRSSRDHAQMPAAIATMPDAIGSAAVRAASGGSASQNASAPSTIPKIPIVFALRPAGRRRCGSANAVTRCLLRREPRSSAPPRFEPDEEDDEPLDDRRQVAGEVGPEDRRVELPPRRAVDQRAEEQRREADADARCCARAAPRRAR